MVLVLMINLNGRFNILLVRISPAKERALARGCSVPVRPLIRLYLTRLTEAGMMVFLAVLGTARLSSWWRVGVLSAWAYWSSHLSVAIRDRRSDHMKKPIILIVV